jgi:hypothetical protein
MNMRKSTIFSIATTLIVLLVIGVGLAMIGSPEKARRDRLDEQRIRELKTISIAIENYRTHHASLPPNLSALIQPNEPVLHLQDPKSGSFYDYQPHGQNSYELCATFQTKLDIKTDDNRFGAFWFHGLGKHCFNISAHGR